MKKIIGVNFSFPSDEDDDSIALDSYSSVADADIVIFCPSISETSYRSASYDSTYAGKKLYDENSSSQIIDHIDHWRRELKQFLKSGKTLIILLEEKIEFYVHNGEKNISGTGRSQKVANVVALRSNYDYIPFNLNVVSANGKAVFTSNPLVIDYYNTFKKYISFKAYIDDEKIKYPLFTTKNKDRILGANLKYDTGNILLFPIIEIEGENGIDEEGYWTTDAVIRGKDFQQKIYEIDKQLITKILKSPTPSWVNKEEFNLKSAEETKNVIMGKRKLIDTLKSEIQSSTQLLKEQEILKDLLFETGKPLEEAVIYALKILGFNAENYNDGKMEVDQVIISPEGHRYIGECEGKDNRAIDISKFRQLLDLLNEDFEREEVNEKAYGLLFGNPLRLSEPVDRKYDFTEKCIRAANRENIGLILTSDLFVITKYLFENDNEEYKSLCRAEIFKQLGGVIKFPVSPKEAS